MVKNNKKNKYNNYLLIIILILSLINIYLMFSNEINMYGNGLIGFFIARKYRIIINLVIPVFCICNLLITKNKKVREILKYSLAISLFLQVFRNVSSIISGFMQFGFVELLESRYDIAIIILKILLIIILLINKNKVLNKLVPILSMILLIYCVCYDLSILINIIVLKLFTSENELMIMIIESLFDVPLIEYILLIYYVYKYSYNID